MTKLIETSLKLKIWKETKGQDLMEYALMAGFLVCASGFTLPQVAASISHVLGTLVALMAGTPNPTAPGA